MDFFHGRNIQDFIGWAYEYLHVCHKSKRPIIYFEKAFYKVEYCAIIPMLKAKGFGPKWIKLLKTICILPPLSTL
jgi:hypothetical protein